MAKIKPNPSLIQGISGAIGGLVYHTEPDGQIIVQRAGERTAEPSEKQRSRNELFKLGAAYGNRVKVDPVLAAEYRPLCGRRMGPYQVALRDFITPPIIVGIDLQAFSGQAGQLIRVVATDDCKVAGVQVRIRQAVGGAVLEEGAAGLSIIVDQWLYTTQTVILAGTPILVEATATDRPGNRTSTGVHFCV